MSQVKERLQEVTLNSRDSLWLDGKLSASSLRGPGSNPRRDTENRIHSPKHVHFSCASSRSDSHNTGGWLWMHSSVVFPMKGQEIRWPASPIEVLVSLPQKMWK